MKAPPNRAQPLIVIAEPDEDESSLLKAILKLLGFQVMVARDGKQAIRLVREKLPDVLMIDLTLTKSKGAAAVARIRQELLLPDLRMVAISTSKRIPRTSLRGSTVFLPKPIDCEQLCRTIKKFSLTGNAAF